MPQTVSLDRYDLNLLDALQTDAGLTQQELSRRVNLSPSQCSRRRQRLEEAGVIRRVRAELDAARLGFGITVFIHVSLATHSPENSRHFRDLVITTPAIQEAHMLTGSADYLLKVVVGDLAQLTRLINDVLLPNPGVDRVRSDIVLDSLKADNRLPLGRGAGS